MNYLVGYQLYFRLKQIAQYFSGHMEFDYTAICKKLEEENLYNIKLKWEPVAGYSDFPLSSKQIVNERQFHFKRQPNFYDIKRM